MPGDSTSRTALQTQQHTGSDKGRKLSNVTLFIVFKTENGPTAPSVKEGFSNVMQQSYGKRRQSTFQHRNSSETLINGGKC